MFIFLYVLNQVVGTFCMRDCQLSRCFLLALLCLLHLTNVIKQSGNWKTGYNSRKNTGKYISEIIPNRPDIANDALSPLNQEKLKSESIVLIKKIFNFTFRPIR